MEPVPSRVYLIAGEDSGDLHAKNLIRELKLRWPGVKFRGMGGDGMQAEGVELVKHIRHTNFMGFWTVVKNLRTIRGLFQLVKDDITSFNPDKVILIDYPGFNLRMAPFIHSLKIPIYYYISPQLWAWKKGRLKIIKRYIKKMFVILPFEKDFYAREGVEVEYYGHPLLDEIGDVSPLKNTGEDIIALLPGSRIQEIRKMLPLMVKMKIYFPSKRFVIAGRKGISQSVYDEIIGDSDVEIIFDSTYSLLKGAKASLVTSGTATLETAIFKVPQVVCYKADTLSYYIARKLIQVKYISLVNLILDRNLVKELIQWEYNEDGLRKELDKILHDNSERESQHKGYDELYSRLGGPGASERLSFSLAD